MVKESGTKKLLHIDDLWDVEKIDDRIRVLNGLVSYGSNYMYDAITIIAILEKRKKRLQEG